MLELIIFNIVCLVGFFLFVYNDIKLRYATEFRDGPRRQVFHHKDNNTNYIVLVDFGDELVLQRTDINARILMKRENFEKYLKEV